MTTKPAPKPSDLVDPRLTPDDCICDIDYGVLGEIQDGRRPKATAISRFASEYGCRFVDVRCLVRYMRFMTRQDAWDSYGRDEAFDRGESDDYESVPAAPPSDWETRFEGPVWQFTTKDDPDAIRVWFCEVKERARA